MKNLQPNSNTNPTPSKKNHTLRPSGIYSGIQGWFDIQKSINVMPC